MQSYDDWYAGLTPGERAKQDKRVARWSATHFVYVITGPSGVYAGVTRDPEARWRKHRAAAVSKNPDDDTVIARAMRVDGRDRYSFEVVAQCRDHSAGEDTERRVIAQLRRAGTRVLNIMPRVRGHKRQRTGRFYGVFRKGAIEPLFPTAEQQGA